MFYKATVCILILGALGSQAIAGENRLLPPQAVTVYTATTGTTPASTTLTRLQNNQSRTPITGAEARKNKNMCFPVEDPKTKMCLMR